MDDEAEGLDVLEDSDIVRRVRKLVGDESESSPGLRPAESRNASHELSSAISNANRRRALKGLRLSVRVCRSLSSSQI